MSFSKKLDINRQEEETFYARERFNWGEVVQSKVCNQREATCDTVFQLEDVPDFDNRGNSFLWRIVPLSQPKM